jgi:hypothetical protein
VSDWIFCDSSNSLVAGISVGMADTNVLIMQKLIVSSKDLT